MTFDDLISTRDASDRVFNAFAIVAFDFFFFFNLFNSKEQNFHKEEGRGKRENDLLKFLFPSTSDLSRIAIYSHFCFRLGFISKVT